MKTTITTFATVIASIQTFATIATQRNHSYALTKMRDTRQSDILTHPNVVGSLNIAERRLYK